MIEEVIQEITKLMIKEHIEGNNETITIKKTDLMKFCIKLLKLIENEV